MLVFDDIIGKLVVWQEQMELAENGRKVSQAECLRSFTGVRLMKLLYFLCLESVDKIDEGVDATLFGLFKNFLAYERGPVEVDTYNHRGSLFNYELDSDKKLVVSEGYRDDFEFEYKLKPEDFNNKEKDDLFLDLVTREGATVYIEMVNRVIDSFSEIENPKKKLILLSTDQLVDLSHNLNLWREAMKSDGKLSVDNEFSLKDEKRVFDQMVQEIDVA